MTVSLDNAIQNANYYECSVKTLIALKILKLSLNRKILTPQLSICAFCSFKMKFQFIVEVGRGKE